MPRWQHEDIAQIEIPWQLRLVAEAHKSDVVPRFRSGFRLLFQTLPLLPIPNDHQVWPRLPKQPMPRHQVSAALALLQLRGEENDLPPRLETQLRPQSLTPRDGFDRALLEKVI